MPAKNFKLFAHNPPGTLKYTGTKKPEKTKMEVLFYNEDEFERKTIKSTNEIPDDLGHVVWLNITGMHDSGLIESIGNKFGIHKIDLEAIVNVTERSQASEKNDYLFSILKMVYLENDWIVHEHLAMILKGNTLITFQETAGDVFDEIRNRIETAGGQVRRMKADYLFNALADDLIDRYYSILEFISGRFNETEASIIMDNNNEMKKVYWLRKELLFLKMNLEPVETSLFDIISHNSTHISKETKPYFDDILNNVRQILSEISTYREMVNSLYETQIANSGNDMNKIMTTLTVFSAIFIPLSFLAGVFGMNFASLPGIKNPSAFIYFVLGCVFIAGAMLIFFKKRKWF